MDSDVEKRVKRWVAVLCIMIKGIQLVVFVMSREAALFVFAIVCESNDDCVSISL